jgi:alpha-2-macroglobulin
LLVWELESPAKPDNKLRALHILKILNSKVNFPVYIDRIEKTESLKINELFRLIELKQLCGLHAKVDTINAFRKETLFGGLYFSDDSVSRYFYNNEIQNTLIAYRILRNDTIHDHSPELEKIRNYLYEKRAGGRWSNTYESAGIIETILPELSGKDNKISPPVLALSGAINRTIDTFPFELKVSSGDSIHVVKKGDFPVYLTAYSHYWDPLPRVKKSDFEISTDLEVSTDFEISTGFDSQQSTILKAGEPVRLITRVKVKKDADYVMVNIRIPAGCSYGNKSQGSYYEVHREYFRNETTIFCENLSAGDYEFTIELIPRYSGTYTMNPAKVEMMYFPTFNANNSIRKVIIR